MKTLQKYPCISCNQEVTQRQEGLLCEGCNRWQHRTCNTGVTRQQYRNAIRSNCDIVWQCTQCSIPEEPNPPATWSAFFQTTRTNNDCEGWHGALNRRAAKSKLPIYLLVQLLGEEAQMVTVEAQLVSEGTLSRYQRSTNRRIQGRLFAAWEDYMRTTPKNLREAKRLLSRCSGIYHPC